MDRLNPYAFIFLLLLSCTSINAQTQIGSDIDGGYANDQSGKAISMSNASSIAIGEPFFGGSDAGRVVIYDRVNNAWVQKGSAIYGESSDDRSGSAVSMPDENTIAIGAYLNDGIYGFADSYIGHVRVFEWTGTAWVQKGTDLDGENEFDRSGHSVCMPDANTVAIGAIWNDGNGSKSGHVRVYEWNDSAWVQKGVDIDGEETFDNSGYSISMPDEHTIAIGAQKNDAVASEDAGHVRIYEWNGSAWMQKGIDIDGEAAEDLSGSSVSMPDANTVAIGAPNNDGNGIDAGQVRVFKWEAEAWVQKGNDIDGEVGDLFGFSVSMPDANTLAVGAPNNDNTESDAGQTRIYKWTGAAWEQVGTGIDGESSYDYSGQSVSMPSLNTVAIAAPSNDGVASNSGHVRVFSICSSAIGEDVVNACGAYEWIDGNTYTENNTTATYVLVEAAANGCDSIVNLNLSINAPTYGVHVVNGCEAYTWIDGNTYYDDNNTAMHTIVGGAVNGCDSIVTLDLSINFTTFGVDETVACGEYLWIDGNTYTEDNNTASHTLVNAFGCDSIVTLNLSIIDISEVTDVVTACESYEWIDGNTYTENNNTATWVLTNMTGCDSILSLDLTINNSDEVIDELSACDSYTWLDGINYTESNNQATWVLSNMAGCDSVVRLDLTINHSNLETDAITVCEPYTWIDGNVYNENNNTATYTYTNTMGCDSVITLNLNIISFNAFVSQDGPVLLAEEVSSEYQWLECPDMIVIDGADEQLFTATENGSYAVVLSQDGCADTSICYTVENVSVLEADFGKVLTLYPNPTDGHFNIELGTFYNKVSLSIKDISGRQLHAETFTNRKAIELDWTHFAGVYFIELKADKQRAVLRMVKQ